MRKVESTQRYQLSSFPLLFASAQVCFLQAAFPECPMPGSPFPVLLPTAQYDCSRIHIVQ